MAYEIQTSTSEGWKVFHRPVQSEKVARLLCQPGSRVIDLSTGIEIKGPFDP